MSGDDGQVASSLPVTPPSWHQITSLSASECALKKLQRPLTTFNGRSARFSRPSSGRGFPPSVPAGPSHPTRPGLSGSGPYTALGRAFLTPLLAWLRFSYPTSSVALNFAPLKCCAGASVVRSCPSPVGASTPRHQAQLQLPRVRHTGFFHRVGASMANGLRPLYCPWPRCFVYHTIAWRGLHFALLCVARDLGWCDHEIIEALVGSASPILLRPGFFLCTLDYEPAKPVHK